MAYEGEYCRGSILSAATVIGSFEQEEEILRRYAEAPEQSGRLIGQGNSTRLYYATKAQCTRNGNRRQFQGSTFDERSVVLIGEGSFGNVYDVIHRTLNRVAVKIFKGTIQTDCAWRELDTLIQLKHETVVNILGACVMGFPCIILEYCLGSLKDLRPSMKQTEIFQSIIHIAEGLKFIHSKRYIHADLKPPNILINSRGRAVIGDLGAGFFLKEGQTHHKNQFPVGTFPYMNLDALRSHRYSLDTDLWSFGCIIYELEAHATLIKTPKAVTEEAYIDFIQNGWLIGSRKVRWEDLISQCHLYEVIRKLLSPNPISAEKFLQDPLIRALPTSKWDQHNHIRFHGKRTKMDRFSFDGKPFRHTELEVANFYYDSNSEIVDAKRKNEPLQTRSLLEPSGYDLQILIEQKEIFRQMLQSLSTGNRNEILQMKAIIQDLIRAGIQAPNKSLSTRQQSQDVAEPENELEQSNLDLVPSASVVEQHASIIVLTTERPGMDVAHTSHGVPLDMEIVEPDQAIDERQNHVASPHPMEEQVRQSQSPVVLNVLDNTGSVQRPPALAVQQTKKSSPVTTNRNRPKKLKRLQPRLQPIATKKSRNSSPQIPDLSTEVYFCFRCRCFITLRLALIRAHSRKCERESRQLMNP